MGLQGGVGAGAGLPKVRASYCCDPPFNTLPLSKCLSFAPPHIMAQKPGSCGKTTRASEAHIRACEMRPLEVLASRAVALASRRGASRVAKEVSHIARGEEAPTPTLSALYRELALRF